MNRIEKAFRAVDALQQRHAWLAFPVAVWKKFGDDQAGNLAALIAYSALVAIFPLLLVLVTVLDIVLKDHLDWQIRWRTRYTSTRRSPWSTIASAG